MTNDKWQTAVRLLSWVVALVVIVVLPGSA